MLHFLHKFFLAGILLVCLFVSAAWAQKYTFEWQLGAEAQGQTQFSSPTGVALSSQRNLYIADVENHRIVMCNAYGEVLLKFGSYGTGDGQLRNPNDVAIDVDGNIYVADRFNSRIQKFTSNGEFLMKFGTYGSADGQFNYPTNVTVDSEGSIYVADPGNNRIQKFDKNGAFVWKKGSTAGNADGQFNEPRDIIVDQTGNILVADGENDRIQKFDKNGVFLSKFGVSGQGAGRLDFPVGLALDSQGNIYVATLYSLPLQIFYPNGTFSNQYVSNEPTISQIQYPIGIVMDGEDNLYLSERRSHIIQKFSLGSMPLWKLGAGTDNGQFRRPVGLATDATGNVYVADTYNYRIQKFNSKGHFMSKFTTRNMPYDVAIDLQGNMYVPNGSIIEIYKTNGQTTSFGSYGSGDGQFSYVTGVAVDKQNNIYVVDRNNNSLQKFNPNGGFIWRVAGAENGLNQPIDVTTDAQGNIYVVNFFGHSVQKFDKDSKLLMTLSTVFVDGLDKWLFDYPTDVAVDNEGKIYVTSEAKVHIFTNDGYLLSSFQTGTIIDKGRYYHHKAAVDASGNVYVTDDHSNSLQKFAYIKLPLAKVMHEATALADNTGSFSFGNTTVGTPVTRTFIIDNMSGMADLILGGLSLPAGFTLASYFPATVPAGGMALFDVQMLASQAGNSEGTLSFTSNDPDRNPYNFTISGKVEAQTVVSKINQTITFDALPDRTYDEPAFMLSATTSSNLPVSFSIVSGPAFLDGNTLVMGGAGTVKVRASQPGNTTYEKALDVERSFTINKANQTISFDALADKTIGDAPITLWAISSLDLPVSFSIVSGPATLKGNTLTLTGTGMVTVKASQLGDANINAAQNVTQSFTINAVAAKQSQTITFEPIADKTFNTTPFILSASSSSSLPVSFSLESGPAILSGNILSLTGAGTVIIKAYQWGNQTYDAALDVERTFTVNKASQSITFAAIPDKTIGNAPLNISGTASSGLPVSFSVVSGPATLAGNSLTLNGLGTVTVKAVQVGDNNFMASDELTVSFCVLPAKPVITINGIVLTSSATEGNQWFINGEALLGATAQNFHALEAGEYTLQVKGPCGSAQVSEVFKVSVSGIEEELAATIKLYPNPANDFTILQLPSNITCQKVSLLTLTGKTVMQLETQSMGNEITIPTQTLAKGVYIVKIETSKGVIIKKLSKMN